MTRKHIHIPQGGRLNIEYAENFYELLLESSPRRLITKLQD